MHGVQIHSFKTPSLAGGTLVASLPNLGVGSMLLTDYLLAQKSMDHVASADSLDFPPVAMVHDGKPRFPVRIHADPGTKLAVLRSEVPAHTGLMRELAVETIAWARKHKLERIVALDGLGTRATDTDMYYACSRLKDEEILQRSGVKRLGAGVLSGFTACLLLESRLHDFEVVALLAALRDPESDLRSCSTFAKVLPAFVPGLHIDHDLLQRDLGALEKTIRHLQDEAKRAIRSMQAAEPAAHDYV